MNRKARRALKALGVTVPDQAPRTEEQIRNEYIQTCSQAGEIQFKRVQLDAALNDVNARLEALNKEYVDLKSAATAPVAQEEATSVQPQP